MTRPQASAGPQIDGRGPRDNRCRRPLRDPGPRRRQARAQRASRRRHRSFDPSFPPTSRSSRARPPKSRSRWRAPRERTVAGRVVDRTGQPVAGATVFQSGDSPARTEAETGADGRFALNGVVARPTFLFARKPGYRFGGLAIASESARRDARDPQGGRAAPAHAENAAAAVAPPGGNRAGAPPARPIRGVVLSNRGASRRRCARSKHSRASSPSACWS